MTEVETWPEPVVPGTVLPEKLPGRVEEGWPEGVSSERLPVPTAGPGQPQETPEVDSWAPVDLGPYLRGEVVRIEPTTGLERSDGLRLLYPGKEHSVIGEMESGKSWFSLGCAAAELLAGRRVVYVHFEEADPGDTIERLLALGVPGDKIQSLFAFVGPERPVNGAALTRLLDLLPSLVVLDGVNEGMSLHQAPVRDEDGVAAFRRYLVKPFTRIGAAVLACDHVVKDRDRRDRGPLGSVHKGNALSGALILLENAEPFGRGQRGRSHVYVTKDRPGYLRRHGRADRLPGKTFLGELVVDDTRQRVSYLDLAFLAPRQDEAVEGRPERESLAEVICTLVAAEPEGSVGSSRRLLALLRAAGHQVRDTEVRSTLDDLTVTGRLEEFDGPRASKGYRVPPTASLDQEGADR